MSLFANILGVLGLSPQSTFYKDFSETYFDPMNRINFLICLYPKHEFFGIDSSNSLRAAQIPVVEDSKIFNFEGEMSLQIDDDNILKKKVTVCLSNDKDLLFQSLKSMSLLLKRKLCKNELHCFTKDDLNLFNAKNNVMSLKFIGGKYSLLIVVL